MNALDENTKIVWLAGFNTVLLIAGIISTWIHGYLNRREHQKHRDQLDHVQHTANAIQSVNDEILRESKKRHE